MLTPQSNLISGFCSREQHYRPEDCGFCHLTLIGKAGSGFWEGGKGTRDKVRMSKKGKLVVVAFILPLLSLYFPIFDLECCAFLLETSTKPGS